MGTIEVVQSLSQALDTREGVVRGHEQRYAGDVPLSYIAPAVRAKLGNRLQSLSVNFCALAVDVLSERLRLTGFTVDGQTDLDLWTLFMKSMSVGASQTHVDALALGSSYVSVWQADGVPSAWAEHPSQVIVRTDPLTRQPVSALKRWTADGRAYAMLYERDKITALQSNATVPAGAYAVGSISSTGWDVLSTTPNPLGRVPVVPFINAGRITDPYGVSEMASIADLNDALTKVMVDMLVTSEASAQPRRWATGIELDIEETTGDDGETTEVVHDPWEGRTTTAQAEDAEAKFGQFSASDLSAYRTATEIIVRQIGALSGLSPQMLGLHSDSAMSADAIRAAEASLTSKAEQRQKIFGRSWCEVARLLVAIRDGRDPKTITVEALWNDPASRSVAQDMDAAVKGFSSGLVSRAGTLAKLGYSPQAIAKEERARAAEAVYTALAQPSAPTLPAGPQA